MIFSSIHSKDYSKTYPQSIQTALDYLKSHDFTQMELGEYEIQGRDIYAQVMEATTGPITERKPEVHENYIDVQFLVTGQELLGFTPDMGNYTVLERHDERDLIFYEDVENEFFIHATPGCYSIFFPNDVHRPGVMVEEPMTIRKVVVKVHMSTI